VATVDPAARDPKQAISPPLAVTSYLYGAGAALTLDEFALWLNLEDDYWDAKVARASTPS